MSKTTTAGGIFSPTKSRTESKADTTTTAALSILKAETDHRRSKTEKLRQARLAHEAKLAAQAPADPAPRLKRGQKAAAKA